MADRTGIEWTDATWNPVRGCSRVSEGCRHCYAEIMAARFSGPGQWGEGLAEIVGQGAARDHRWTGNVRLAEAALDQPLRWRRPRRIFVNSTSDLFHEAIPDDWIDCVFAVMALAPQHIFQILTKRPERMREYVSRASRARVMDLVADRVCDEELPVLLAIPPDIVPPPELAEKRPVINLRRWPLPNVWLGVSVEDQAAADARIPLLLATAAEKRFISAEPLLGPVNLRSLPFGEPGPTGWRPRILDALTAGSGSETPWHLDWVIAGGESGPGARPMHPDWPRALRDQCAAAGVPFFFKQWGEWFPFGEIDAEGRVNTVSKGKLPGSWHDWPKRGASVRLGKKAAGASLDGCEHREFPA